MSLAFVMCAAPKVAKMLEPLRVRESTTLDAALVALGDSDVACAVVASSLAWSKQLLQVLAQRADQLPLIVVGAGSDTTALQPFAVLHEPVDAAECRHVVRRALALASSGGLAQLHGDSKVMDRVRAAVQKAGPASATVLVRGESGTGKELVARAVHDASARREAPFVKIHCAALPDALLESELFGYEKGAFTGADVRKLGRVDVAQGGTLFLDEIGDITLPIQVKLLRLLQDRQYERLGSTQTRHADVRFVAATHRNLEVMVDKGEFRQDLFYRLNVLPIWVPPLRARRSDVDLLAQHFCRVLGPANGRPDIGLSPEALAAIRKHRWPGNVRQLQNFIERLVVLAEDDSIGLDEVTEGLTERQAFVTQATASAANSLASMAQYDSLTGASSIEVQADEPLLALADEVRAAERGALVRALKRADNNRSLAARLLGVSRPTLYKKLKEHGLD